MLASPCVLGQVVQRGDEAHRIALLQHGGDAEFDKEILAGDNLAAALADQRVSGAGLAAQRPAAGAIRELQLGGALPSSPVVIGDSQMVAALLPGESACSPRFGSGYLVERESGVGAVGEVEPAD